MLAFRTFYTPSSFLLVSCIFKDNKLIGKESNFSSFLLLAVILL